MGVINGDTRSLDYGSFEPPPPSDVEYSQCGIRMVEGKVI